MPVQCQIFPAAQCHCPLVTFKLHCSSRLPVQCQIFPAAQCHCPLASFKLCCPLTILLSQVPGSLPCSQSMHMAQSQELETASRSSETYQAENSVGRPASVRSTSVLHQGSRRHRTELPGAHSRERLRHRQAPNDDTTTATV